MGLYFTGSTMKHHYLALQFNIGTQFAYQVPILHVVG
jgi:hypothetical protein